MRPPSSGARASLVLAALVLPVCALAQTAPRPEQPAPDQAQPPPQAYPAEPPHAATAPNSGEAPLPPPPPAEPPAARYPDRYRYPEDRGPEEEPLRYRRHERRAGETHLDIGASLGLNSPAGIVGGEIEYRALPQLGLNLSGGLGGWGPRFSPLVRIYPIGYSIFSPFLEAGLSLNLGYSGTTTIDGERHYWTFLPQVSIPVSVGARIALGRYVYVTARAGWVFRTGEPPVSYDNESEPDGATALLAAGAQHYGFLVSGAIGIAPF